MIRKWLDRRAKRASDFDIYEYEFVRDTPASLGEPRSEHEGKERGSIEAIITAARSVN